MQPTKFMEYLYSHSNNDYSELENKEAYLKSFGVITTNGKYKVKKKIRKRIEFAYKRACENRDFEINKFWTRSAFFWGFIALIFGAYFTSMKLGNEIIELLTICLGFIFSFGWHFANIGSKYWQENWEKHIDILEDFVTGPIYKIIYYKGTFYSVSKITQVLSFSILLTWIVLLIIHLYENGNLPFAESASFCPNWTILIALVSTLILILSIVFGYCKKSFNNTKKKFIQRKPSA